MTNNTMQDLGRRVGAPISIPSSELEAVTGGNPLAALAVDLVVGEAVGDIASEELPKTQLFGGRPKVTDRYKPVLVDPVRWVK